MERRRRPGSWPPVSPSGLARRSASASNSGRIGFADVVVHPGREARLALLEHGVCGHGDDAGPRLGRPTLTDPPGCVEPVELGHLHVHQDDVVGLPLERLQRLETVRRHVGAVAEPLENPQRHHLVHGVVLGQQDPQGRRRGLAVRRGRSDLWLMPALGEHGRQCVVELRGLQRLRQLRGEVPGLRTHFPSATDGRDENEWQLTLVASAADLPCQCEPVHLRQHEVEHGNVEVLALVDQRKRVQGPLHRHRRPSPTIASAGPRSHDSSRCRRRPARACRATATAPRVARSVPALPPPGRSATRERSIHCPPRSQPTSSRPSARRDATRSRVRAPCHRSGASSRRRPG